MALKNGGRFTDNEPEISIGIRMIFVATINANIRTPQERGNDPFL